MADEKKTETTEKATEEKVENKPSSEKNVEKKAEKPAETKDSAKTEKTAPKKTAAQKAQEAAKAAKSGEKISKKTSSKSKTTTDKAADKASKEAKKADKKAKSGKKLFGKKDKAPELVEVNLSKKERRALEREKNKPKRRDRRKSTMIKRSIGVVALFLICGFVVVGIFKVSGHMAPNAGLACRVDSAETKETDVTNYIQHNTYYSYYAKSSSNWGQFLSTYGMKPETFRKQVIEDKFVHDELVRRACSDKEDIEVTDEEVDEHVQALRDKFKSDSDYKNGLTQMGYTEETYRESVKTAALEKKLKEKVAPETEPTDEAMVTYMNTNKSTYNNAKRSSHILFGLGDKETAQQVLDQLKAGTITWDQAVSQYSTDTATKEKGGDCGWDKTNSFVSEYTTALSKLEAGGMSEELVQSDYGYHIIKCTDKWTAPDTITSVSEVPEDILKYCRDKKKTSDQTETFTNYLTNLKEELGIIVEIYNMPADVPYNVDMSKYGTSGITTNGSTKINDDGSVTYSG